MKMSTTKYHRKSIRLKDYDYSQAGVYFVTICTHNRTCFLGDIINGEICLNDVGRIVESEWENTGGIRQNVIIDTYVIMPNHLHGILIIYESDVGATGPVALTNSLGSIIGQFKSVVTKKIRKSGIHHFKWQRNYFERVIRNEKELNRIREYIITNSLKWTEDKDNPTNRK